MPAAICDQGHVTLWRNQRGSRLSELRCDTCGQAVSRADYRDGSYQKAEPRQREQGGKAIVCPICGKKRLTTGRVRTFDHDATFYTYDRRESRLIPAGTLVCWFHDVEYPYYRR